MEYSLYDLLSNDKPGMVMEQDDIDLNFNCWILEDGHKYKPCADTKLKKHIQPNIYDVKVERQTGEIYLDEVKNVSDDLIRFNNSVIDTILKDVTNFWEKRDMFKKLNMVHKRGILLSGAPGTGKSCAITLISEYIKKQNGIVINVTPNTFIDAVSLLTSAFRKVEKDMPVVVIMEDIDQYDKNLTPIVLDFLDGKKSIENILVVMTSNDTTDISGAILRPGRVDRQYVVPELSEENRRMYFESNGYTGEKLEELVSLSDGFNISQCKTFLVSHAILGEDAEEVIDYISTPIERVNYMISGNENTMQL